MFRLQQQVLPQLILSCRPAQDEVSQRPIPEEPIQTDGCLRVWSAPGVSGGPVSGTRRLLSMASKEGKSNIAQSFLLQQVNTGTLDSSTFFVSSFEEPSTRLVRKIHPACAGRRVVYSHRTFSLTMHYLGFSPIAYNPVSYCSIIPQIASDIFHVPLLCMWTVRLHINIWRPLSIFSGETCFMQRASFLLSYVLRSCSKIRNITSLSKSRSVLSSRKRR
jgi:hypothetical protein